MLFLQPQTVSIPVANAGNRPVGRNVEVTPVAGHEFTDQCPWIMIADTAGQRGKDDSRTVRAAGNGASKKGGA